MRTVIQRVSRAHVDIVPEGEAAGESVAERMAEIGRGLLVLVGVTQADGVADAEGLARKIVGLRIFEDTAGKMNLSLGDIGGELLVVSQFTLMADARKGRRPSFGAAAPPEQAEPLIDALVAAARAEGVTVVTGCFGAHMHVGLENDGPVTILLDSQQAS